MKKILAFILLSIAVNAHGQHTVNYNSADIQLALNKLNVLGSVLYIAAHPDDENQAFLSYMAKGRLYRSAYMSLTRGDGGQNLLGPEQGAMLGVIRTQELLAARRIDGAQQFFSRAVDFGYSKTAKETLNKWDREKVLADVVKVIRIFRPDVIATRFSETNGGHGHHLSSAILAIEAFHAAADPERFSEQLDELETWQPKRIYWNSWLSQEQSANKPPLLEINFGEYNALLGLSYQEIASKSRTMHKSQGFGSTPYRGEATNNFSYMAGDTAYTDLFDGIETSWQRVPGARDIEKNIREILIQFDHQNPGASLPMLTRLYKILDQKKSSFWISEKKKEVKELIRMCSGLWLEAIATKESVSPGNTIRIRTMALNRSIHSLKYKSLSLTFAEDTLVKQPLEANIPFSINREITIPEETPYTQPYWLKNPASETMFNIADQDYKGAPQSNPELSAAFSLQAGDQEFLYTVPVEYRWNDPTAGEQYKPVMIEPAVSIAPSQKSYIFVNGTVHDVIVTVTANTDSISGKINPEIPTGWNIEPTGYEFDFTDKNEQSTFNFKLKPDEKAKDGLVKFNAIVAGKKLSHQVIKVNYDHIPEQNVLVPAEAGLVKLDITVPQKKVAYIMGSGDKIPEALNQIGIEVDLLDDQQLATIDYNQYNAVICGVRAFNTRENLALLQNRIIDYVEQGGTWIVQHNTRFGKQVQQIGPYSYTARGRDRISEEDAPLEILLPDHQIFNYPNKITQADFKGWVQERATYMAESWTGKLYPLLAGHDEGEPSKLGGLLYAPYGKGVFIFTAMSWFRQLPAGVPGAYRLFVNMICAGDKR